MSFLPRAALAAVPVLAVVLVAGPAAASGGPAALSDKVTSTATLPPIPLSRLGVADDRGVNLGGIGSDIFPTGRPGEYWTITDRGPNGQITIGTGKRRTFPTPDFNPTIVKVRTTGGVLKVEQTIPLTTTGGKPVTGLPNQLPHDEQPYTYDASTPLPINPNGLDTEGIVRAADGTFWLVDEYGPSLVHVSSRRPGARPVHPARASPSPAPTTR